MKPDIESINRLGFDAWADNLIANALEDMNGKPFERMTIEGNDYELCLVNYGDTLGAMVKAYVPGTGWLWLERSIKVKGKQP